VRRRLPFAELALVAYFAVAVVVGLLPSSSPITHRALVAALAFSPSDLVSGKLWLLPLSGVVVDGETWTQLAVLAETAVVLVVMAGARTFWRAAVLAHVGSTLVAYAVLAVLAVVAPSATGDLFRDPDYGVSCIWAGAVGALAVVSARRCASRPARVAVAAAVSAPLVVLLTAGAVTPAGTLNLATVEHLFAFLLGALAVRAATPGRRGFPGLPSLRRVRPAGDISCCVCATSPTPTSPPTRSSGWATGFPPPSVGCSPP
jgi:peptidoglycan/LPS O-acetylase OafA/YrhL